MSPELPTAVPVGTLPKPSPVNGTLFFVRLEPLDVARHGIAVNENAGGEGVIVDPTRIKAGGPNRNAPGLEFTFNAGLRSPTATWFLPDRTSDPCSTSPAAPPPGPGLYAPPSTG